ncbi:MAG: cell division protein ZapA [Mogibacterium sp.]|nr:cell division protein ZapA [Mogibacterium sp.]
MEKCRADVVICGENYVLSGEKSEEKIKEIAKFVDEEIRRTSKLLNCNPNYKCAVLASLNICEKLMERDELMLKLQTENYQLDNDVKHYISMWESAKRKITDLKEQMSTEVDKQSQSNEDYNKLKEQLAEMESAYFDLQMENVNLKNQLRAMDQLTGQDEI